MVTYYTHRVKRDRTQAPPPLPKDVWKGSIFVEADGTVCEVIYSGRHMPSSDLLRDSWGRWQTIGHPVVGAP